MRFIVTLFLILASLTASAQDQPLQLRPFQLKEGTAGDVLTSTPTGVAHRRAAMLTDTQTVAGYVPGDVVKISTTGVMYRANAAAPFPFSLNDPAWVPVDTKLTENDINNTLFATSSLLPDNRFNEKTETETRNLVAVIGDSQSDLPIYTSYQYLPLFTYNQNAGGPGWYDFQKPTSDYHSAPTGMNANVFSGSWVDTNLIDDTNLALGLSGRHVYTNTTGSYVEISSNSYNGAPGVTDIDTFQIFTLNTGASFSISYNDGTAQNFTTTNAGGLTTFKIPAPGVADKFRITHQSGDLYLLGARLYSAPEDRVEMHFLGHGRARASQWSELIKKTEVRQQFQEIGYNTATISLGTNDARSGVSATNHKNQIGALVDSLKAWLPGIEIVYLSPPRTAGEVTETLTDEYETSIKKLGQDKGFQVISIGELFGRKSPAEMLADGLLVGDQIHYSPKGSTIFGRELYKVLTGRFPDPTVLPANIAIDESVTTPVIYAPNGRASNIATYSNGVANVPGAFRVSTNIPANSIGRSFISIRATGYNYDNDSSTEDWIFSGYISESESNYFSRSSLLSVSGDKLTVAKSVEGNFVFYLGDTTVVRQYPHVRIEEVQLTRLNNDEVPVSWLSGWAITTSTSTGTDVFIKDIPNALAEDPSESVTDPVFTGSVTTPIIINTSGVASNLATFRSGSASVPDGFRVKTQIPYNQRCFITIRATGYRYLNGNGSRDWLFSGYINESESNYFSRNSLISSTGEKLTVGRSADGMFVFYLGGLTGTVSYPMIRIDAVQISRLTSGTVSDAWLKGWTISAESTTGTDDFLKVITNSYGRVEFVNARNKQFGLLASYTTSTPTITGAFVLKTNINRNNEPVGASLMRKMGDIDFLISPYQQPSNRVSVKGFIAEQNGGNVTNVRYQSSAPIQVRAGVDAAGNVVYILGDVNSTWSFPQVFCLSASFGFDSDISLLEMSDWTLFPTTDISSYANVVTGVRDALTDTPGDTLGNHIASQNLNMSSFRVIKQADGIAPDDGVVLGQAKRLVLGNHTSALNSDITVNTASAPKIYITSRTNADAVDQSTVILPAATAALQGQTVTLLSIVSSDATFGNSFTSVTSDIQVGEILVGSIEVPAGESYRVTCRLVDNSGTYRWVFPARDNYYTGWGSYSDTEYTDANRFNVPANTKLRLPNNAGIVNHSQKPIDIDSFFTAADTLLTGRNGDGLAWTLEVTVVPSVAANAVTFSVDIGGAVGEIYPAQYSFPKGAGVARPIIYAIPSAYTLGTFETNGGRILVEADGAVEIHSIRLVCTRTHKAR